LLGRDGRAQVRFHANAVLLLRLKLRGEVAGTAAAGVLRLVQREVGLEDQVVHRGAVDRPERTTDRDADPDLDLVDHVWLFDRLYDAVGQVLDRFTALRISDDNGELVAAHAADVTGVADFIDEPLRYRAKHGVALRVAEGVVDRFEPVEV